MKKPGAGFSKPRARRAREWENTDEEKNKKKDAEEKTQTVNASIKELMTALSLMIDKKELVTKKDIEGIYCKIKSLTEDNIQLKAEIAELKIRCKEYKDTLDLVVNKKSL